MRRFSKGFSLVELMIVVAIIGILAAIAIPNFITMQLKAKRSELPGNVDGIKTAELSYDARLSELLSQRFVLAWNSQCYGWSIELREANYRDITERDYRFSLTLKHVGTFLDLNDSF